MLQIHTLCECKCKIDHSVLTSNTHMLTNHTEIQNHLTRKYEKLATCIVQLAKYELNWTRKPKLATRTFQLTTRNSHSQLELATRTRNLQLATCNSQNTSTPFLLHHGWSFIFFSIVSIPIILVFYSPNLNSLCVALYSPWAKYSFSTWRPPTFD